MEAVKIVRFKLITVDLGIEADQSNIESLCDPDTWCTWLIPL